jgi:hypothetical protein
MVTTDRTDTHFRVSVRLTVQGGAKITLTTDRTIFQTFFIIVRRQASLDMGGSTIAANAYETILLMLQSTPAYVAYSIIGLKWMANLPLIPISGHINI